MAPFTVRWERWEKRRNQILWMCLPTPILALAEFGSLFAFVIQQNNSDMRIPRIPDADTRRKLKAIIGIAAAHWTVLIVNNFCFIFLAYFSSKAYIRICVPLIAIIAAVVLLVIEARLTLDMGDKLANLVSDSGSLTSLRNTLTILPIVLTALDGTLKTITISLWTWLLPKQSTVPIHYEPTLHGRKRRKNMTREGVLQSNDGASIGLASRGPLAKLFEEHERLRLLPHPSTSVELQQTGSELAQGRVSDVDEHNAPQLHPSVRYWHHKLTTRRTEGKPILWVAGINVVGCAAFEFTVFGVRRRLGYSYTWNKFVELVYPVPLLLSFLACLMTIRYRVSPAHKVLRILRLDFVLLVAFYLSLILGVAVSWSDRVIAHSSEFDRWEAAARIIFGVIFLTALPLSTLAIYVIGP